MDDMMEDTASLWQAVTDAGVDAGDLRYVEFDLPGGTLAGYGYDLDALPDQLPAMLPDGWEVHEVCSDIDDDDVLHAGVDAARLPLRMGLLAGRRLSAAIGAGELARVDPDDWGFTDGRTLESDTARQWAQATDPAPACDMDWRTR